MNFVIGSCFETEENKYDYITGSAKQRQINFASYIRNKPDNYVLQTNLDLRIFGQLKSVSFNPSPCTINNH